MATPQEIHRRLMRPPNAVPDRGIDLGGRAAAAALAEIQVREALDVGSLEVRGRFELHRTKKHKSKARAKAPAGLIPERDPALIEMSESIDFRRGYKRAAAIIAAHYGFHVSEITNNLRRRQLVRARFVTCYILREDFKLSYTHIGRILRRDHTTSMYGYAWIKRVIQIDEVLAAEIKTIREKLK